MKNYQQPGNSHLNNDLFAQWEQELILRHQFRSFPDEIFLTPHAAEEEMDVIWRALYFSGQKERFWSILTETLQNAPVLSWLAAEENRLEEFLTFLPAYLTHKKPELKKLQYLVNLFREKYMDRFAAIIAVMDAETCSYLVSRTANPQLRKLINQRLRFLAERKTAFYYGLDEQLVNASVPSMYGDKLKLLATGLELLQIILDSDIKLENEYNLKLEAAEIFFRAGMIDASLALLMDLYRHLSEGPITGVDVSFSRQFNKQLRTTAAVYCLIHKPEPTSYYYSELYHMHFRGQRPDDASIKYFIVYDLLKEAQHDENCHVFYKIAYEAEQISLIRNHEYLLLSKADLDQGFSDQRINELKSLIEQKLISLPHEAFITLKLLEQLGKKKVANASMMADFLLDKTLVLFKWLPSSLFLNSSLISGLAPLTNDENRYEAEKIIVEAGLYDRIDKISELNQKPELLKSKDAVWLRQILAGKYLGVL